MNQNRLQLIGQRFGRLTVIEEAGVNSRKDTLWKCKCDCGNETIVRGKNLTNGNTKSCGCLHREMLSQMFKKHGGVGTRLYNIFYGMQQRCCNPKSTNYKWYGAKGIKVCNEWIHDFATFRKWAFDNGYKENLTIDRIDPNKDYCPENCRWITLSENVARSNRQRKKKTNNIKNKCEVLL